MIYSYDFFLFFSSYFRSSPSIFSMSSLTSTTTYTLVNPDRTRLNPVTDIKREAAVILQQLKNSPNTRAVVAEILANKRNTVGCLSQVFVALLLVVKENYLDIYTNQNIIDLIEIAKERKLVDKNYLSPSNIRRMDDRVKNKEIEIADKESAMLSSLLELMQKYEEMAQLKNDLLGAQAAREAHEKEAARERLEKKAPQSMQECEAVQKRLNQLNSVPQIEQSGAVMDGVSKDAERSMEISKLKRGIESIMLKQ